jgi:hypothetical protein
LTERLFGQLQGQELQGHFDRLLQNGNFVSQSQSESLHNAPKRLHERTPRFRLQESKQHLADAHAVRTESAVLPPSSPPPPIASPVWRAIQREALSRLQCGLAHAQRVSGRRRRA